VLALTFLGGMISRHLITSLLRPDYVDVAAPDLPVPFGPNMAWLAVDTTDTEAVAAAIDLRAARPATWAEGIEAAHHESVFVTPPLADWTLAAGRALLPPGRVETFVAPLLEQLSERFSDAQFFCTFRDIELHVWARALKGQLVRGYGWLGEKSLTLWNEGAPTKEERVLDFRFLLRRPEQAARGDDGAPKAFLVPEESCVMHLACCWSIDPTTLNAEYEEPAKGLLGGVPWSDERISQGS
jgi:hypothetical protein